MRPRALQGMILPSLSRSYAMEARPSGVLVHASSSLTLVGGLPLAPSNKVDDLLRLRETMLLGEGGIIGQHDVD